MTLALAGVLLLAPLWAWHIGAGWPPSLRDNAFKTLGVLSAVMLATVCWPLGLLWGLGLWHWRDPDDSRQPELQNPITGVLVMGTICAVLLLAAHVPRVETVWLQGGILAAGAIQLGVLTWQAVYLLRHPKPYHTFHFWRDTLRGSMGNRIVTGGFLAFCLALAPVWLIPVYALGVLATSSYTAFGAAAIAIWIRYPEAARYWMPVAAVAFLVMSAWRGNPLDSILGRRAIWRLCLHHWWLADRRTKLVGGGHYEFQRQQRWWHVQGLIPEVYSHAHQDAVQFLLEYGAVGLGAMVALVVMVLRGGAFGDPWTAALVAGLLVGMNQFTLHLPHTGLPVVVAAGVLWGRLG